MAFNTYGLLDGFLLEFIHIINFSKVDFHNLNSHWIDFFKLFLLINLLVIYKHAMVITPKAKAQRTKKVKFAQKNCYDSFCYINAEDNLGSQEQEVPIYTITYHKLESLKVL